MSQPTTGALPDDLAATEATEATQATETPPGAGHGHRHLGLALTIICAAQLMVVLDGTIVNIALPHIQQDLGFSQASLSWVVNSYTLAFGGLLLLGGRAGDLLGRRKVFVFGVVLFAIASLFGGVAQNETMLLASRVLQGVGAAIASPTALSLITTTFPAGPPRNRAFAVYGAMSGAGAAIGLILGGALTEASWRWTFFINVPIGLLVAVLAPRFLGESERHRGEFDVPGALLGTLGLVSLVYGLTHAATDSWSDPVTIGTLALGVVLLALFLVVEARQEHPLLPFRVLQNRTRGVSFFVMLVVGAALFSMFYFLGLYIQVVLGYSPIKAGFAFLPFSVGIVIAAQVASALVARIDPRWISGTGALLATAGMYLLTRLEPDSSYAAHLLPSIVVLSLGMGLVFIPMTLTSVHGVRREDSGVASAVLNTMQQVGGSLGLAALSTVATRAISDRGAALAAAAKAQAAAAGPGAPAPSKEQLAAAAEAAQHDALTYGFTHAFWVSAGMVLVVALVVFVGLTIRHQELATDGPQGAHVG